jgi:hypothetical protein
MHKQIRTYLVGCLLVAFLIGACRESPKREKNVVQDLGSDTVRIEQFRSYSSQAVVGEVVYVPVYSHIYQQKQNRTFNLTSTLSFRNTDLNRSVTLKKVYYFDSKGNLVEKYLDGNQTIKPLSSVSYVIEEADLRGGVGANFLVLWESKQKVNKPVIETIMISTSGQQGISFVSEGRVIDALQDSSGR